MKLYDVLEDETDDILDDETEEVKVIVSSESLVEQRHRNENYVTHQPSDETNLQLHFTNLSGNEMTGPTDSDPMSSRSRSLTSVK